MNELVGDFGFELRRNVFNKDEIAALQKEATRISYSSGSACVRHLTNKSKDFEQLALCKRIQQLLPASLYPVRSILFDKTPKEN